MHKRNKIGTMDIALIIVVIILIVFTIEMIYLFKSTNTIPDTLVNCVFGALTGELGVLGWIKTCKEKNKDRINMLEDEERQRKYLKEK